MRIAVIGAGLAGVTTAYELARRGHEVTVYERRGGIAAEGSFAPACINAPGFQAATLPSSVPGLWTFFKRPFPSTWAWTLRSRRAARHPHHSERLRQAASLARRSMDCLRRIEHEVEIEWDRHPGALAVFREARTAERARALLSSGAADAAAARWVAADEVRKVEPGLARDFAVEGGWLWPAGHSANGRQFAHALKAEAQRLGVKFLFHQEVVSLKDVSSPRKAVEVGCRRCTELADSGLPVAPMTTLLEDVSPHHDAVVLCSASAVQRLQASAKWPLSVEHVHTITAPLGDVAHAGDHAGPQAAFMDVDAGLSVSRIGARLRIAGAPRWGKAPLRPDEDVLRQLYRHLEARFPGAARTARGQAWVGRQSSLPDRLPAVGALGAGIWANTAHGAQSWAWAPAAADLIADLLDGVAPQMDIAHFDPTRFR